MNKTAKFNKLKFEILGYLSEHQNYKNNDEIANALDYPLASVHTAIQELLQENRLPQFYFVKKELEIPYINIQDDRKLLWEETELLVQKTIVELGIIQNDKFKYWDTCLNNMLECSYSLEKTHFVNIQTFMVNLQYLLGLSIFFQIRHVHIPIIIENVISFYREQNETEQCTLFSLLYFLSSHHIDYPQKELYKYLEELKNFEESTRISKENILLLSGLVHFQLAEYNTVVDYYKKYSLLPKVNSHILHELFCMNASMAALFIYDYPLSIGIMESQHNTNLLSGKNAHALHWFVQLSFILVHTKNYDTAERNFKDMLNTIKHVENIQQKDFYFFSYVFYSCQRGLAYLHYTKNNHDEAYKLLTSYPITITKETAKIFPFDDPLISEMIFELSSKRKIPHYGAMVFQKRIKHGMNLFLQGIIYRLSAQYEERENVKLELLKNSFDCFCSINNKKQALESAKLYANFLKINKKTKELKELQEKIHQYNLTSPELVDNTFLLLKKLLPNSYLCINKCSHIDFISFNQYVKKLLEFIQHELEAQCVALIKVRDEKIYDFYQINISDKEREEKSFQDLLNNIIIEFQLDLKASVQYNKINNHNSALYLRTSSQHAWILYLNTNFINAKFLQMLEEEALLFGIMLSNAMRMASNFKIIEAKNNIFGKTDKDMDSYFGIDLDPLIQKANLVALSDIAVLIQGETGTGKEDLAKFIHKNSQVKGKFIAVQLSSISEQLFESSLFGSEKGSYTGSFKQQIGLLELAHNGSLFLDEVADIPMSMQIKLLRVFQEKKFSRVGGTQLIDSNFRLICATNKNLWEEVKAGRFREDLYYRLSSVALILPPLRERPNDLWEIAKLYLEYYAKKYNKPKLLELGFTKEQQKQIQEHLWQGNIRELQSVLERYVILDQFELTNRWNNQYQNLTYSHTNHGEEIFNQNENVEEFKVKEKSKQNENNLSKNLISSINKMPTLKELEKKYIQQILEYTEGKIYGKNGALHILGLSKSTLYKRINEYNDKGNI